MSISFLQADAAKTQRRFPGLVIAYVMALVCPCLPAFADNATGPSGFVIEGKPFSTKRILVFPKDYSLGELIIGADPSTPEQDSLSGAAKGTVVVPAGKFVTFIPAASFYKDPSIINTIPPYGIDSIGVFFSSMADAEDDISDRTLSLIGHLKGLVKLRLDRCDATDKGVAFARELPDLQMISGFQTSFEGKCFKALAGHKKLRSISLPTSGMKDENVQYLAALPRLQFLTLSRCHLSDAGIQNLSGCVELRYLDLSDNPYITDRSIKPLLALKNLRVLILSNTSMTNLGAKQFKQLKLERLKLPQRVNQPAELKAIQEAMPGIRVNAGDGGGKKVDSETNKLFAPLH